MEQQPRKHFAFSCILFLIPVLACGFLLYIPVSIHYFQLGRFADNLYKYPLPPKTTIVSNFKKVDLMGNGNHCDFLVGQVMATKLSRQEIESYYQDAKIPAVWRKDQQMFIHVSFDEPQLMTGELIFKISVLDFGNPTNFDLRCH